MLIQMLMPSFILFSRILQCVNTVCIINARKSSNLAQNLFTIAKKLVLTHNTRVLPFVLVNNAFILFQRWGRDNIKQTKSAPCTIKLLQYQYIRSVNVLHSNRNVMTLTLCFQMIYVDGFICMLNITDSSNKVVTPISLSFAIFFLLIS